MGKVVVYKTGFFCRIWKCIHRLLSPKRMFTQCSSVRANALLALRWQHASNYIVFLICDYKSWLYSPVIIKTTLLSLLNVAFIASVIYSAIQNQNVKIMIIFLSIEKKEFPLWLKKKLLNKKMLCVILDGSSANIVMNHINDTCTWWYAEYCKTKIIAALRGHIACAI